MRLRGAELDRTPILVFWETTKACPLACRHCRATAMSEPQPGQLSTAEGRGLIDEICRFGPHPPVLVLTGGDPLCRPDIFDLAGYAHERGIPVALAPSVTPNLNETNIKALKGAGVKSVSISLDGAFARSHEDIRGVPGHFDETLDALRKLVAEGFKVQVNTTVMRSNVEELADVAHLVRDVGAHIWEVFFLIKVGRGSEIEDLTPVENEQVCHFLYDASRYGFVVRTVEAPFFRRVARWRAEIGPDTDAREAFSLGPLYGRLKERAIDLMGPPTRSAACRSAGTRDGRGIVFVSHSGIVHPAGFLPAALGSVRRMGLVDIYRNHPLLRAIRRADFGGRCGVCSFKDICGGSRSRAFASSGDPLGEDPGCSFDPMTAEVGSRSWTS